MAGRQQQKHYQTPMIIPKTNSYKDNRESAGGDPTSTAKIILFFIKAYQKTLSPDHGAAGYFTTHQKCRYYPSCSEYCRQSIEKYGAGPGLYAGLKRIARCHPWHEGGYDPVR